MGWLGRLEPGNSVRPKRAKHRHGGDYPAITHAHDVVEALSVNREPESVRREAFVVLGTQRYPVTTMRVFQPAHISLGTQQPKRAFLHVRVGVHKLLKTTVRA